MSNHDTHPKGSRRGASRRSSAPRTLTVIMGALGVSDIRLGHLVGDTTRQTINKKKTGRSALTADDIDTYAAALGIPPDVLMRSPSSALAWLAEHRRDQLDALEPTGGRQADGTTALEHKGCLVLVPSVGAVTTRRAIMPVPVGAGAQAGVSAAAA